MSTLPAISDVAVYYAAIPSIHAFDPNQKRDKSGRWTESAAANARTAELQSSKKPWGPFGYHRLAKRHDEAARLHRHAAELHTNAKSSKDATPHLQMAAYHEGEAKSARSKRNLKAAMLGTVAGLGAAAVATHLIAPGAMAALGSFAVDKLERAHDAVEQNFSEWKRARDVAERNDILFRTGEEASKLHEEQKFEKAAYQLEQAHKAYQRRRGF